MTRRSSTTVTPELRSRIRRLYASHTPLAEIAATCGVGVTTIYAHVCDLPRRGHVGGRHLTAAQIEKVLDMGQRGLGAGLIAREIGCVPSSVTLRLIQAGIRSIRRPGRPVDYYRHGRPVRGFRPEEDAFIETLSAEGLAPSRIAERYRERFGTERHPDSIRMRLVYLAARDEGIAA